MRLIKHEQFSLLYVARIEKIGKEILVIVNGMARSNCDPFLMIIVTGFPFKFYNL
jgi:hypothetical protein